MFLIISTAAGVSAGYNTYSACELYQAVTATDTTIYVTDTTGLSEPGVIVIEDELISYSVVTSATVNSLGVVTSPGEIKGSFGQPLTRGSGGTTAAAHPMSAVVRSQEAGMINSALGYTIAQLSDSSGIMMFISLPLAFFRLLGQFLTAPLTWLGSDLAFLTYLWGILGIAFLLVLTIQFAGGRHT